MATTLSSATAPQPSRKLNNLGMVWRFTRRYPAQLTIAAVGLLVSSGATLLIPATFKLVVDKGFASHADTARIGVYFERLLFVVLALAIAVALIDRTVH